MRSLLAYLGLPALVFAQSQQIALGISPQGPQKPILPTRYWYGWITHNGEASFMDPSLKPSYNVFRNVVADFQADNTGIKDASVAIQAAINAGARNGPDGNSRQFRPSTEQPAVVYLPAGTYMMANSLQLFVGTILMGDPINPPILKAIADFPDSHVIWGKDPQFGDGTQSFFTTIKNIVIDTNNIDKDNHPITLLDWTVSQATQLTNIVFNMPNFSSGHKGLNMLPGNVGFNSNIILNDLTFNGGLVGMDLGGEQWVLKGLTFNGCTTGINAGGINVVVTNSSFTHCGIGISAFSTSGSLIVLDSAGTNVGALINANSGGNSIILENIQNTGDTQPRDTVVFNGNPVVTDNVPNTWVHGNIYTAGNPTKQPQNGFLLDNPRSSSLLVDGKYFAMKPPTYQEFSIDQVLNIKTVSSLPVFGNGADDDTVNINIILSQNVGKLIYFPAGTYIVSDTITIPADSRIYGDAYASAISARGDNFKSPNTPTPMVRLGNPNDVGVGQISDMLFTVADVLPGCKLLEVNMAGNQPGDVGIWNSHFRVGGADGTTVRFDQLCSGSPDACKAAWGMLHLTNTSSAYIENMWGWTADHDLDRQEGSPVISTGRGALIEATKGTWLVGTAMEHNTLYQYNFNNAANVASIFQQSETAYWQGHGNEPAPQPWTNSLQASDPTFADCGDDAQCGMGWFERISGCKDMFLYGGCDWAFFNNHAPCGDCQANGVDIENSWSTYIFGTNVRAIRTMFRSDGQAIAERADNGGGFQGNAIGGVVAAYLFNSE